MIQKVYAFCLARELYYDDLHICLSNIKDKFKTSFEI